MVLFSFCGISYQDSVRVILTWFDGSFTNLYKNFTKINCVSVVLNQTEIYADKRSFNKRLCKNSKFNSFKVFCLLKYNVFEFIEINNNAFFIAINLMRMCYYQHKTFQISGDKRSMEKIGINFKQHSNPSPHS